ncbi:MAG: DUF5050 domain-containing protein [Eubacteriales bacterium]|nr:DUF5050 domain-containing protein [Eubacteriales bacterium]
MPNKDTYLPYQGVVVIVITAVIIAASFCFAGCDNSESSMEQLPVNNPELPYDQTELDNLMFNINIAGSNLVISDGTKIYFTNSDGKFVNSDPDGKNSQVLRDAYSSWPIIANDQFFYAEGSSSGTLSKMRTDGSSHVRIGSTELINLVFYRDSIYAIELPDRNIVSFRLDGTNRTIITDYAVNDFILYNDCLYISGKSTANGLAKYQIEQQKIIKLADVSAANLQADKGNIYYADLQEDYNLYSLNIDDNSAEKSATPKRIIDYRFNNQFSLYNNHLIFIDETRQHQVFSIELKDSIDITEATIKIDDAVNEFCIIGDYIFYRRSGENRLYSVVNGESRPTRVN